ncbi:2981_t:CDS:2, partial [Entrophospora sp. SA101]
SSTLSSGSGPSTNINNINGTSDVWIFFNKINNGKAQCYYEKMKQTTLKLNRVIPYSTTSQEYKLITDKLVNWIAMDTLPFTIVESPAFHEFISSLNEKYAIPSRLSVKNIIVTKFNRARIQIKQQFEKFDSKVSFTTDIWSNLSNEAFIGITVHYIDNNWNMRNFVLDIIQIQEQHTGINIANKILDIIEEFNLCTKTLAITSDNASNMIKGCKDFGEILEDTFYNYNFIHQRCAAHVINIAVKHGMELIFYELSKLKNYVKKVKNSVLLCDELRKISQAKNEINQQLVRNNPSSVELEYLTENDWKQIDDL